MIHAPAGRPCPSETGRQHCPRAALWTAGVQHAGRERMLPEGLCTPSEFVMIVLLERRRLEAK